MLLGLMGAFHCFAEPPSPTAKPEASSRLYTQASGFAVGLIFTTNGSFDPCIIYHLSVMLLPILSNNCSFIQFIHSSWAARN
jgi:hypothetical protein